MSADAKKELMDLLAAIFRDGVVEVRERDALHALLDSTSLGPEDTHGVFVRFVERTWGEALADGVITGAERSLLLTIQRELRLVDEHLPIHLRHALAD